MFVFLWALYVNCLQNLSENENKEHVFDISFLCTVLFNPKHLDVFDGCECVAVCVYCSAAHNDRALPL